MDAYARAYEKVTAFLEEHWHDGTTYNDVRAYAYGLLDEDPTIETINAIRADTLVSNAVMTHRLNIILGREDK